MGLVESFVVGEEGISFCGETDENPNLLAHCKCQNKNTRRIRDLYIDWKVTYPYMLTKHYEMLMDDVTPDNTYFEYEEEIHKYENQLMRRAINLRMSMWT